MPANRILGLLFFVGRLVMAGEFYRGAVIVDEKSGAIGTQVTLVLEREDGFIIGWLALGETRQARVYGSDDKALKLLWSDASQALLTLEIEGASLKGSWEPKGGEQGGERFLIRRETEVDEERLTGIAQSFSRGIVTQVETFNHGENDPAKLKLFVALAQAFPTDHKFAGYAAVYAYRSDDRHTAASWYREAAKRAYHQADQEALADYHNDLTELQNVSPKEALKEYREAVALPPEKEAFVEPFREMNSRVNALYRSGSYNKALQLAIETKDFANNYFGLEHPYTLTAVNALASLYQAMGRYEEALAPIQTTLERSARVLGESHPQTLVSRNNLAGLYNTMGRYEEALSLYQATLAQSERVLGEIHPQTLASRNNLAGLYKTMGRYEEALPLYQATLAQSERVLGEIHPRTLSSRHSIGVLYVTMGRYEAALPLYQDTLAQSERVLGESHPDTLVSRNNLAGLYEKMGRYKEALPLYRSTLAQSELVLGESHPQTLGSRNNLALLYQKTGSYEEALPLLFETVVKSERVFGEGHPQTLASRNNLALLHKTMGRYEEALALYQSTVAKNERVLGKNHPDTLISRNNLAALYQTMGRYEQALPLFQGILAETEQVFGERHPQTLRSRNNLASLYQMMGRYEEALPLFQDALTQREGALGKSHPHTLESRNNLAGLYQTIGRYEEALILYQGTLVQSERVLGESHPHTLSSRNNFALAMVQFGDTREALHQLRLSFRYSNRNLERLAWDTADRVRHSILAKESAFREAYLSLLADHGGRETGAEMLNLALRRDGMIRRIATAANQLVRASEEPALKTLVSEYRAKQSLFAAMLHRQPEATEMATYKRRLNELEAELEQLENRLAPLVGAMRPEYREGGVEALGRHLGLDVALVNFFAFHKFEFNKSGSDYQGQHLIAVIAKKDGEKNYPVIQLGQLEPIAANIQAWRLAVTGRWHPDVIEKVGRDLYTQIWQPLARHLVEKDIIYVVADGHLQLLPIGALPDPNGKPLNQSFDLVFMDAAYDLLSQPTVIADGSPLVCSAPDFGENPSQTVEIAKRNFAPLPGAQKEGENITALFEKAGFEPRHLTGKSASETLLREALAETPNLLHIASHGFFQESLPGPAMNGMRGGDFSEFQRNQFTVAGQQGSPLPALKHGDPLLRSGIALAGANLNATSKSGDDGLLTALEAEGLNLDGTRLVVLSACETGVGSLREGEGVYGLRRAFFLAGARALLTTLWSVDDAATRRFMERFYKLYLDGTPARQALLRVQREFQSREHDSHPVYWAPFHLIEIPEFYEPTSNPNPKILR